MGERDDIEHMSAVELLCEALGLDAGVVREISREPLAQGSVTGFEIRDGDRNATAYVDTSLIEVPVETGLVQEGVGRIWMHPADPHLPALAPVAFGHAADTLLDRLHIKTLGEPEIVGYRPGRRAVLKVPTTSGTTWIKVVRRRHVERIVDAHAVTRAAGLPVPRVAAWSPDGLLILDEAVGTPASESPWIPEALVAAATDIAAKLASVPTTRRARSAALDRVAWYADRVVSLQPSMVAPVAAMTERLSRTPDSYDATIHGDLHFGQMFLTADARTLTGLIDVDTLGRGDAAEDPAAFLSHAIASAALASGEPATRLDALVSAALVAWGDSAAIRGRAAAQLIGHAASAWEQRADARAARLWREAEALVADFAT